MSLIFSLRPETEADRQAVLDLNFAAFDGPEVPALVMDLHQQTGAFPTVSLVATDADDMPIGHVMLSHAWLDAPGRMIDILVLSPLAVVPALQRQGVGRALIRGALKRARDLNAPLVFLEGNPAYYSRCGFRRAGDLGFRRPSLRIPEGAFQVACLPGYDPATMTGTLAYRDAHWRGGVGLYRQAA